MGLWYRLVVATKESKTVFAAVAFACIAVPWAMAEALVQAGNRTSVKLEEELRNKPNFNPDAVVMAKVNNQRLQELLDDLKNKHDINDRYVAALKGEILTGPPEARVRRVGGSSMDYNSLPETTLTQQAPDSRAKPTTLPQVLKQQA